MLKFYRNFTRAFTSEAVLAAVSHVVGDANFSVAATVKEQHSHDESYHRHLQPDAVVWPTSIDQVSEIARICHKHKYPLIPFGSGTGMEGGIAPISKIGTISVNLSKLNEVTNYHPEDFDVTVQSGILRLALNEYVKGDGLWFPIDPGADCSLCGMVATSASGTNAVRYGTMRENVMNLQVVLANGDVIHTAGENRRFRKTSAGYNLTNLFVGSEGTLGIITAATIRLHGVPDSTAVAVCNFPSVANAIDAATQVIQCGIPVARLEFLDDVGIAACNAYSKLNLNQSPTLFMEFHGTEQSVKEQTELAADIASTNNSNDFNYADDPSERKALWTARHNAYYASIAFGEGSRGIVSDVCVPISRLTEAIVKAKFLLSEKSPKSTIIGHVGDGNFHCILSVDDSDETQMEHVKACIHSINRLALEMDGTCTGEHGIGIGKRYILEEEIGSSGFKLMKLIKSSMDPHNILNPGKIFI